MQTSLRAQLHKLYDRVVHHRATIDNSVVGTEIRDSPSERITMPMSAAMSEGEQEHDDGDREDGENWVDAATERALENLPADRPLLIDDEPTARHESLTKG